LPCASKRAPIAASIASGHPSPLDELTVTMSPSRIKLAAADIEITFCVLTMSSLVRLWAQCVN
jgi:hypothetical protein